MKFFLPLIIFFAFVFSANAQTAAGVPAVTEFDVNGLKVLFKQRSSSPTVSAGLFIRGGVRNQTAQNAGIENLTLSVAVESSKKYPREALRKELSRTGSVIGGSSTFDFGVMSLTSTSENLERSWDAFTDLFLNPTFAPDDVDRIKSAILAGLRNETASPDSALGSLEEKVVYAGHPYANGPAGTIETVSKLTPADLRAYHKTLLQTSRLLLVIVGDADPAQIKRLVTASFGKLPKGTYRDTPTPKIEFAKPSLDTTQRSLNTNYVKGVFAAPSIADPDYCAMRVAMAILQGHVYQEVRIKRNLSYAPNAEMGSRAANTAEIYVTSIDANQSVDLMLKEIKALQSGALDQGEFEGVPGYFLTTYYIDQETNGAQAADLARYELFGGGWKKSFEFLNGVRSVTARDVQAAANKYMKNLRFIYIGNTAEINRTVYLQ